MARLRLFASIRQAAGTGSTTVAGSTVGEVVAGAVDRYGPDFEALLECCRVWLNGEPAEPDTPVRDTDEVALLPPVSGGCEVPSERLGSRQHRPIGNA